MGGVEPLVEKGQHMPRAIETTDLCKNYGAALAVNGLSLHVDPGEIYGFLGLNGAGKTTTLRMLLGMISPTAGEARVLGAPISPGRGPWEQVGYLAENPAAYRELTVRENLEAARRLRPGLERAAIEQVIQLFGLTSYANRRAGALSHGNMQRLGLARAMLHRPQLLLLDEPANGLDPAGIVEIRELLASLAHKQGVTVFMSSHILAEVAKLADRIGIIHHGRLIRELDAGEMEHERRRRLTIRALDLPAALADIQAANCPSAQIIDDSVIVREEAALAHPEILSARLTQAGHPPTHLAVEEEDLESFFLRLIGWTEGSAP